MFRRQNDANARLKTGAAPPCKRILYLPAIIALLFYGCAGIQNSYQPVPMQLPEHWQAASPQKEGRWPDADWWTQFGSAQLTALIAEVKSANDDIQMAAARIRKADAYARIAGAALLPTVDVAAGISHIRQIPGQLACTKQRTADCYVAALSANYEIDFWGKNASAAESALALAQASRMDQAVVALSVAADVAATYFNIVSLRDRLAIARDSLANARRAQDNVQRRFAHGLAAAGDLERIKTLASNLLAAIPPLELQLRQQINALAALAGRTPGSFDAPEESGGLSGIVVPAMAPGIPSELLARRPDIQSAETRLIAANADINHARAALFPSISLTAGGGFASTALTSLLTPGSAFYTLGGSLLQPVFRGGALAAALDYRKERHHELLREYHKTVIAAFSDVESSLAAAAQTAAEETAQKELAAAAQNAYALVQQQFTTGLVDIDTVLNAQRTLFSASDALVQAKLSRLQAQISLYKALGGGWRSQNPTSAPSAP